MLSLILSGVICSCSGKEETTASNPVKAITLNSTSLSLIVGETATITATISPSDASNKKIIWSSSNANVATVNDGEVSAIAVGTADIIAVSDDSGKSATCHIKVTGGSGEINGTPVITGDYSYDGYTTVVLSGTCNVEPLPGVSVMYGIMYSNEDLTTDPKTEEAEEKDANNKFSCEITTNPNGETYYYRAFATRGGETFLGEIKSFKAKEFIPTTGDAIDMGVSVKWASCNLGATKPEEEGNYYAWGETKTKSSYSQDNYKFYVDGKYSKYNSSDGKTVLDLEDDAANVTLHGNWRMPTNEEAKELLEKCELYEDAGYNGVPGTVLVSTVTGNVLFFPDDSYWTSSLCGGKRDAYTLFECISRAWYDTRYSGHCLRPVLSSEGNTDENKIEISVTSITSSTCKVSLHPNASGTYFWEIIEKATFDEYGGEYVLNYYVSDLYKEGTLGDYLDEGDKTYDYKNLSAKTKYVVFAGYCGSDGKVKSKVFTKSFTTQ